MRGNTLRTSEKYHCNATRVCQLSFYKKRWNKLCSSSIQDPDPPCRDWERAFRDAVRDIRAVQHGITIVRIYYRDFGDLRMRGARSR